MIDNLGRTLDYALYDSLWAEYRTRCFACSREILAEKWESLTTKVKYHLVSTECTASVTD